jgi:DNA-binding winged helix-turn-helix (wHTH) protein/tetratricopeptide (TPR) repeat protein
MATVRFDKFELDLDTGRLTCRGISRRLENQPRRVLSHLIAQRNRLVSREELIKLLWPDQIHGDFDHRLDKVLAKMRVSLNDQAANPKFVETLRGRGFQFIGKVESPEAIPPLVPSSAIEVDAPTRGLAGHSSPEIQIKHSEPDLLPQVAPMRSRWPRVVLLGATAVASIILVSLRYMHSEKALPATPTFTASLTSSVLVLGLKPATDGAQSPWISEAMTMWLADAIETGNKLHVVSGKNADAEEYVRSVANTGMPRSTLSEIRSLTGADLVIFGTYEVKSLPSGPIWHIELWAQSTHNPDSIQQANASGLEEDGPNVIKEAQGALAAKHGFATGADKNPGLLQAPLPTSSAAARLYMEGLLAMARFDPLEASGLLTQAVELQPDYAYTHVLLAEAWTDLGNRQKATQEYELALRNSQGMSPRQQAELWALRCRISGDWTTVANVYTDLLRQYPGNAGYMLKIAWARIVMGRGKEALSMLSAGPASGSHDRHAAQFALARSAAEANLSQFDGQLTDATLAQQSAETTEQPLVAAKALVEEGHAHFALGQWNAAEDAWQKASGIFSLFNDRRDLASDLYEQSRLAWVKREPAEAKRLLEKSIELSEGFENDPDRAAAYAFLGVVRMYSDVDPQGETKVVEDLFAKANHIYPQIGNIAGQGMVFGFAGDFAMCQSQYVKAHENYVNALDLSQRADDRSAVAGRLLDLGIVASELADNTAAKSWYTQSIAAYRALGQQDRAALAQNRLANVLFREGDVDQAILLSRRSLETMTAIGYTDNGVMEDLARFEMERNPSEAEKLARQSLNASTDKVDPRALSGRYMVLAEAELSENKLQDAKNSIHHAFELKPVLGDRVEASEMLWARAEIWRRCGQLGDAKVDLRRALAISQRYGSKRYEMPVRLALAEVDLQSHSTNAYAEMKLVQSECQKLGYLLYAREATTELASAGAPPR